MKVGTETEIAVQRRTGVELDKEIEIAVRREIIASGGATWLPSLAIQIARSVSSFQCWNSNGSASFSRMASACGTSASSRVVSGELQAALEAKLGIRPRVVHDHGSEFVNRDVAAVIKAHNLIDIKTRPRHPESNGIVERFNGTVREETDKRVPYHPHGDAQIADTEGVLSALSSWRPPLAEIV